MAPITSLMSLGHPPPPLLPRGEERERGERREVVVVVVVVALLSPRIPTRREESAGPVIPLL